MRYGQRFWCAWFAVLAGVPASAQSYRLNDSFLPGPAVEEVTHASSSADGELTVYRTTGGQLYAIATTTGAVIELTVPGVSCGASHSVSAPLFQVSPDSLSVVFMGDGPGNDDELYSVPSDGSAPPVKIDGTTALTQDLFSAYSFTPDGQQVIFVRPVSESLRKGLFVTPVDGGSAPAKLSPTSPTEDVRDHLYVPSRDLVVFLSDGKLYSCPLSGGPAVQLEVTVSGFEGSLSVSPDGDRVLYLKAGVYYSRHLGGGAAMTLGSSGGSSTPAIRSTPGSDRAIFASATTLYSRPIDGSGSVQQLSQNPPPSGFLSRSFAITPDGSSVVYKGDLNTLDRVELFSVPVDGSAAPVNLSINHSLGADAFSDLLPWSLDPDGSHVVYVGQSGAAQTSRELVRAPVDGSSAPSVLAGSQPDRILNAFAFADGGVRIVFQAGLQDPFFPFWSGELFSVPADGSSSPTAISHGEISGSSSAPFFVGGNGPFAHYLAPFDSNKTELFRTLAAGGQPATVVSAPLRHEPFADVDSESVAYGDGRVLFRANDLGDGSTYHLYSAPADGSASPVRLSADTGNVNGFVLSPDRRFTIYHRDDGGNEGLSRTPVAGGAWPVNVTGFTNYSPYQYEVTPDGSQVVFLSSTFNKGLNVVPSDGSAAPRRLHPGLSFNRYVRRFCLSPDSTHVVFVSNLVNAGSDEVYSVPLDGSSAPLRLNLLLPSGGNVLEEGLAVTPQNYVLYRADQFVNERFELFSVPIDLSTPAIVLGPTPVSGGHVLDVFPGERAVFLADALEDERFELFAAPADGSEVAVQLNPALVAGGDVDPLSVRRTADGQYVAFCADAALDGVNSLYSARVDGSVPAQLLHGASHVDADSLTLDPLRESVLFVAGGELFRVQLDGLTPARALARPVGASALGAPLVRPSLKGGAVYRVQLPSLRHALALADLDGGGTASLLTDPLPDLARFERILDSLPNSGRVFYVADQEAVGTFELFGVFTPGPPSPHVKRR